MNTTHLSKNEYVSTQTTNHIIHTMSIYNLIYGNEKISRCASSRHNFVVVDNFFSSNLCILMHLFRQTIQKSLKQQKNRRIESLLRS